MEKNHEGPEGTVLRWFYKLMPDSWNPLFSLGATSFYLFWIVTISGLYLFVFFETSIDGAYASVQSITSEQYYVGQWVRGLHRYASGGMAVTVSVHLLRELVLKRFTGPRWFSWVSGVPLLWLLFASAIGGYWLIWDERAQYIALSTARLFDALPISAEPMSFGFVDNTAVSDRFFTLLIFLHIGIPLSLLLGMFIHIKRINNAKIFPGRPQAAWILGVLSILSFVLPATSLAPADLDRPLRDIDIDWLYMNVFGLIGSLGPGLVWLGLASLTALLISLPVVIRPTPRPVAAVDPEFCNGCSWCFADCPYEAIYMKPHETKPNHQQAVVIADNCVGCGICAGACPSVTPFKSLNQAYSGIDLVGEKNFDVLEAARAQIATVNPRILVVGCAHGVDLNCLDADAASIIKVECIGQMPPSYVDFLCRREKADAVILTGCSEGSCYHRLGVELQEQRLSRMREPHLKYPDSLDRIEKLWVGKGGEQTLVNAVTSARERENA